MWPLPSPILGWHLIMLIGFLTVCCVCEQHSIRTALELELGERLPSPDRIPLQFLYCIRVGWGPRHDSPMVDTHSCSGEAALLSGKTPIG